MKNIIAIFLIFIAAQVSNIVLAKANEFKNKNGVESFSQESISIFGTPKNGFIDGSMTKQQIAGRLLGGDVETIRQVKETCKAPSAAIKNTCNIFLDYLA